MAETNKMSSNDFLREVLDSIKLLNDLATRLDERVKTLGLDKDELHEEVDALANLVNSTKERIAIVERNDDALNMLKKDTQDHHTRIIILEASAAQSEGRWQKITSFVIQIIYAVVTCYLLWKLELGNISTPP